MMSGIPLPTQLSQSPGGGIAASMQGLNALQQSNATAKYAPYQAYADAFLKNQQAQWLPYQYRMQALSNPMLWLAAQNNPQLKDQITKMMSDPMQGVGSSSVNIPPPQSGAGNGLLGMFLNKIGVGGQSQNPMQGGVMGNQSGQPTNALLTNPGAQSGNAQPGNGSAMLPSTQGTMASVAAHTLAPYQTQVVDPGKSYQDPNTGEVISAPTAKTATALQTSINAAQRVTPQLERIASEAAPFMTLQGELTNQFQRGKNYIFGGNEKLPTGYAKFQSDLKAAPEALVKSYGLNPTNETIERMANVIEPYRGETADQYKQRILGTLENIKDEQIKIGQSQLYGGIKVSPDNAPANSSGNSGSPANPANSANASGFDVNKMLGYKFSGPEEFNQAMKSLSPKNQQLVIAEMHRRGWK
ncbi:MAG: hypothetical protein PHV62_05795 [Sulfuricurvum sp.]|nr:hypothetical protein [Sulfuricurvum sp.]